MASAEVKAVFARAGITEPHIINHISSVDDAHLQVRRTLKARAMMLRSKEQLEAACEVDARYKELYPDPQDSTASEPIESEPARKHDSSWMPTEKLRYGAKDKSAKARKPSAVALEGGAVAMASDFVTKHASHKGVVALRRWKGDWYWYQPKSGHYTSATDERIDSSLYRKLNLARPQDVRDVRHALIAADCVLIDEAELGTMLDGKESAHQPHELATCPNGILHLPTGKLEPATARYFSTTALGVAYDPKAKSPARWLKFLEQLWPDDPESIAALQEWFGYLLTPDTRQQKILLLVGPKRSGKGTIARVLMLLLGRASVAAPSLASLGTNFGLQPLIGKTAAIIGDARLGGRTDIAQVVERLLSVSGEDAITIDRKHREAWTGSLSTRVALISNELPRFSDASDALPGRMVILELTKSWYGKEDMTLTGALASELPGILVWAIEGWKRLNQRGHFVQPVSSAGNIDELADLASPVGAWVRERCSKGYTRVLCSVAYDDYRAWCERMGHHVASQATFGRDLKAVAGCRREQARDGEARAYFYIGIDVRGVGQ